MLLEVAGGLLSGSLALLADAGHEVWAVDLWREHVEAINRLGLRVEGASGDRTVRSLRATQNPADVGTCDLYIIATKAAGVAAAAEAIAPLLGPDSLVLTIQNGLEVSERLARHLPSNRVLLGVAEGFGASMEGPGHAHHNAMKLIRIGEPGGGASARLERLAELWRHAGFQAQAFEDIDQLIWEKFLCNVTFSAPCTVFGCTVGVLMQTPEWWRIALSCTAEAHAVGRARGVTFGFDDPLAYVTDFGAKMPAARPSMLLDHLAGRASEIDAINGMVPLLGREAGIATPCNDVLTAVVRAREAAFAGVSDPKL